MVRLPVASGKAGAEIVADVSEHASQARYGVVVQSAASIFRDEDQVRVQARDNVPTSAIFHVDDPQAKMYRHIMEHIRGHVYTLRPTADQEILMARTAGVVRLVYNLALEQRRTWGGRSYGGSFLNFGSKGSSHELSALRREFDWIGAVSQTAQNQALVDLDKAYANFFAKRADYPTPRRKGLNDSFRHVGREVRVRKLNGRWSEVLVPKIGWIRYRDTRQLRPSADGTVAIRNATVSRRRGGGWQVSISTRAEIDKLPTPEGAVGVDRGVAIPYALSTGETTLLPATMKRRSAAIRRAQKDMSRRNKGSRRYAKARSRAAKLRARDARTRAHVTHLLTRRLVRDFGLVAIEDLKIRSMTKSAKGTIAEPGTNVAQKRGLNRAILNVGWYEAERQLAYKLEETGGVLVKVPAAHTSQTCSACGHVDRRSRESQAIFRCTACDAVYNADTNAAINIRERALRAEPDRRGNAPLLDVEGRILPREASTRVRPTPREAVAA